MRFIKPLLNKSAFHCPSPNCGVYANQTWGELMQNSTTEGYGWHSMQHWKAALCDHCKDISLWHRETLVYPANSNLPLPNEDLSKEIQEDYNEAANIIERSPRASAALLRLAIQKLCKQLGQQGDKINDDIGELVQKGLPVQIQQALDIVRVIGNEAVHPGQIDLKDNKEIAYQLFELVNIIAQTMLTQPKNISMLYSNLPKDKLKGIIDRDS